MVRLRTVVEAPGLGLRLIAGADQLNVELLGALVSEHEDPTPWLSGGELLMTDALFLRRSRVAVQAYVQRLVAAGVRALAVGVGTGLPFIAMPRTLLASAEAAGLPLVQVPVTTPFIRITEVVYTHIAEHRFADTRRMVDGQRLLAAAVARADGTSAVLSALCRLTGLWTLLCDVHGAVLAASPPGTESRSCELAETIERVRPRGLRGGATVSGPGGVTRLTPVGTERLRGFLAYGQHTDGVLGELATGLASFAVVLLSIDLERRHTIQILERRPGSDAIARLLAGTSALRAGQLLAAVGVAAARVCVLLVAGADGAGHLLDEIAEAAPESLLRQDRSEIVVLLPAPATGIVERLRPVLLDRQAGLGGPVSPHHCAVSLRQARRAMSVSSERGGGLVDAMHLGSVRLLLQTGTRETLTSYADAVLGPLDAHRARGRGDLTNSLRAFLEADGGVELAAAALRVHRHTVRSRLRLIEEITSRRLDSVDDRAELWLALRARDIAATLD